MKKYADQSWAKLWDAQQDTFKEDNVAKVLLEMTPPAHVDVPIAPLLIFWRVLQIEDGEPKILMEKKINHGCFSSVWIFSMSAYLRRLIKQDVHTIRIEMKKYDKCRNKMTEIFG